MKAPRVDRNDDGFTMIELVVTVMLLGIIMAPLAASMIISLTSTLTAEQRTTNSNDQQLLASYFQHDVQSADDILANTAGCGVTGVLRMHWTEVQSPPTSPLMVIDRTVAYTATADNQLHRVSCQSAPHAEGTAAGADTEIRTVVLVNALSAAPTGTCDGAACSSAALPACATSTCLAKSVEDGVLSSGSTTVSSATAALTADYVGGTVTGTGIPSDTRIASVSGSNVVLTAAATATSTNTSLRFTPRWRPVVVELPMTVVGSTDGASYETYTFELSATRRVTE